jgi:hypothetical protein
VLAVREELQVLTLLRQVILFLALLLPQKVEKVAVRQLHKLAAREVLVVEVLVGVVILAVQLQRPHRKAIMAVLQQQEVVLVVAVQGLLD